MQYSMIIASILSVTLAQKVAIGAPARGAQVEAGSEVTVQVQRPVSVTIFHSLNTMKTSIC
jgi:hypothetical protein